jgi:hypothetical protein
VIELFLTSDLTAISKIPGMNQLEEKLLVLMIDLMARESSRKMSWIIAVRDSRKKKMSTTAVPVPVVTNLHAASPSTVEMKDTA